MKINRKSRPNILRIAPVLIPMLALGGCAGSPPQPSPAPRGTSAPTAPPARPPVAQSPGQPSRRAPGSASAGRDAINWRDLPPTAGQWTYSAEAAGSAARFGQPGLAPLLILRCDRSRPAVVIRQAGAGTGEVPATLTTSSTVRRLSAAPSGEATASPNAAIPFEIALNVRDPALDALAFSRGRFMLEMGGAQTLVLPAWSELGRVIEDCR